MNCSKEKFNPYGFLWTNLVPTLYEIDLTGDGSVKHSADIPKNEVHDHTRRQ